MLARVIGTCWQALVRDVMALGYRKTDIFTTLDLADMVAIAAAAPPNSSVRYFLEDGWSREAHLLANMQESQAGMANLMEPYERPGAVAGVTNSANNRAPSVFGTSDSMTWEEMDELDAKRRERGERLVTQGVAPRDNVRVL